MGNGNTIIRKQSTGLAWGLRMREKMVLMTGWSDGSLVIRLCFRSAELEGVLKQHSNFLAPVLKKVNKFLISY